MAVELRTGMNSGVKAEWQSDRPLKEVVTTSGEPLDFDLWAVAVRRQMLAALKKRESTPSV